MTSNQITPPTPMESATSDTFEVRDNSSANWVVRKIVEARAYAQHVKKWAEAELRRAQREEQFFLQHYGHQLEDWARARISKDRRRKSIKLPAGTVGFRIEPTKVELKDDEKVIAWCRRSLPHALAVRTLIIRAVLTEHVRQTGECPDGADITGGKQRFYIGRRKK
jgi:Bacteriophage Mu Gam like protein